MPQFEFAAFFATKLKERGISLSRLAELSGISVQHLSYLMEGDMKRLPPAPYLRGYILKLGKILDFDGGAWWEEIKDAEEIRSAANDTPSSNRFAVLSMRRPMYAGIVVVIAVTYFAIRLPAIVGSPALTILSPAEPVSRADVRPLRIAGTAARANELFLNTEKIPLAADGSWEKTIALEEGLNTIEIRAKKFLGRETTVLRQVFYEAPTAPGASTTPAEG